MTLIKNNAFLQLQTQEQRFPAKLTRSLDAGIVLNLRKFKIEFKVIKNYALVTSDQVEKVSINSRTFHFKLENFDFITLSRVCAQVQGIQFKI